MARLVPDALITHMLDTQQWALRIVNNTRLPGTSSFYSSGFYCGDQAGPLDLVVNKLATHPYPRIWFRKGTGNMTGWALASVDDVTALFDAWVARYGWCKPNPYQPYQPPVVCPPVPATGGFLLTERGYYIVYERDPDTVVTIETAGYDPWSAPALSPDPQSPAL